MWVKLILISYRFESEDGIVAAQQGELKKIDEEHSGESVKGGYSYTDEDGQTFSLTYTADENGYRPVSIKYWIQFECRIRNVLIKNKKKILIRLGNRLAPIYLSVQPYRQQSHVHSHGKQQPNHGLIHGLSNKKCFVRQEKEKHRWNVLSDASNRYN